MVEQRYLLRVADPEDAVFAFRAAKALEASNYTDCIYSYRHESGEARVWAYRTKAGAIGARAL